MPARGQHGDGRHGPDDESLGTEVRTVGVGVEQAQAAGRDDDDRDQHREPAPTMVPTHTMCPWSHIIRQRVSRVRSPQAGPRGAIDTSDDATVPLLAMGRRRASLGGMVLAAPGVSDSLVVTFLDEALSTRWTGERPPSLPLFLLYASLLI